MIPLPTIRAAVLACLLSACVDFNLPVTPTADDAEKECVVDPANTTVDGEFGPKEWDCTQPMAGKFSFFYVRLEGNRLHVLNDWFLRDIAATLPQQYNLFQFSTGGGKQNWQVKVFGDNHCEVAKDGQPYAAIKGASGFHASPNVPKQHAIYEFLLGNDKDTVLPGPVVFKNKDPNNTGGGGGACGTGMGDDDWLVEEPTVFSADLQPDGTLASTPLPGPVLISFEATMGFTGLAVKVLAAQLGQTEGSIVVTGPSANEVKVLDWTDTALVLSPPTLPGKYTLQAKTAKGVFSNKLQATLPAGKLPASVPPPPPPPPPPEPGKCIEGQPCDDGNPCTKGDTCYANNVCSGKVVSTCSDDNPCTKDGCDPATGCTFAALPDGKICDDGNVCSTADVCSNGQCKGVEAPGTPMGVCQKWGCDPATGKVGQVKLTGTLCDDGQPCTKADICVGGTCQGGVASCDDGNSCTTDSCNAATGACVATPLPDAQGCNDSNPCTAQDLCGGGFCTGKALQCDDGDPKTSDACQPGVGCVFVPK